MADNKKMVEEITSMDEDFARWYTDIVKKAELIEYASIKGCMVLRPYGYAIWENMQNIMDDMIKETGHKNSAVRRNGRVVFSHLITEHHWLQSFGKSLYELITFL